MGGDYSRSLGVRALEVDHVAVEGRPYGLVGHLVAVEELPSRPLAAKVSSITAIASGDVAKRALAGNRALQGLTEEDYLTAIRTLQLTADNPERASGGAAVQLVKFSPLDEHGHVSSGCAQI